MANPVVHFEIIGADGEKLKTFYGEVFGWSIDSNNPMSYGMVSKGAENGISGGIAGGDPQQQGVTFYVEVPNLEESLQAVEQRGGRTVMPPMDVPGGPRMAHFLDPEGHHVGMIQAGTMDM